MIGAFKKRTHWGQAALSAKQWNALFKWAAEMKKLLPDVQHDTLVVLSRRHTRLKHENIEFPRWSGQARLDPAAIAEAIRCNEQRENAR